MKLEKLLCLKYWGSKSLQNSGGFQTMKLVPASLHETTESVLGLSTISYVFNRNGAGAPPPLPWCICDPSSVINRSIKIENPINGSASQFKSEKLELGHTEWLRECGGEETRDSVEETEGVGRKLTRGGELSFQNV